MKYQILFSGEKQKYFKMSSANAYCLLHLTRNVKAYFLPKKKKKKKKKNIMNMSSAELAQVVVKVKLVLLCND